MPRQTNSAEPPIALANTTLVAIDLGAESCRTSLLRWIDRKPSIEVIHRFPNSPLEESGGLHWDIAKICEGVEEGLRRCADLAPQAIAAIGVDGWAVDYARLNPQGHPMANPFCYRDPRNIEAQTQVHARISPEELYTLTGIQILPINTLYQLFADTRAGIDQSIPWTNLPEFMLTYLGGRRISEYTNATHTQLVDAHSGKWCNEIFTRTGLRLAAAPPLVAPGTRVGRLTGAVASLPAFRQTQVIAPACHDTASAIAGIPDSGDDWAFISSGTWSLVGAVLDRPCINDGAREKNFSNEGGIGGRINFLKNVNGMWLLHNCIEQWRMQGQTWTFPQLIEACAKLPSPDHLLDVDDPALLLPGNMPARINAQFAASGKPLLPETPASAPKLANLIFHSLAARYAAVLRDLAGITGKKLRRLYIVGGGSRNLLLNRLTAAATGLEVIAGSPESTTVGNFAIQLASLAGDYQDDLGVSSSAVAQWAGVLSNAFAPPAGREMNSAAVH